MDEELPRASDWKRILALMKDHKDVVETLDPGPYRLELEVLEFEAQEGIHHHPDWYESRIAKVRALLKVCEDRAEVRKKALAKITELATLLEENRQRLTEEIRLVDRNATLASLIPREITDYHIYFTDRWISEPLFRDKILGLIPIATLFTRRSELLDLKRKAQHSGEGSRIRAEAKEFFLIADTGYVRDYLKSQFQAWKEAQ